ncbi:beta-xylosidase [Dyadobacter sp. CY345]|uniref:GH39 family glycosyl hydrolase n=1 Tax=Dyadobacter sp. CY345 TaxID=2909335 RepID=UPI001F24EC43|nr:beta-xylosidase [Dyadobacter sp. CY345]MCF2443350.1 beta-xylosidase [Dyadobacter sp. CY345]
MRKLHRVDLLIYLLLLSSVAFSQTQPAVVKVDFSKTVGHMTPIWSWFGYDEPNFTYMKDGKKLLTEMAALSPAPVYVRTHNLMTSGDGTPSLKWGSTNMYTEDAKGKPVYNWAIVDSIFDAYVSRKMKPLAQIGFMPEALSTHPQPYKHDWKPGDRFKKLQTGWTYPPKDYNKWSELVYHWVMHCVARYGKAEVESWYWELWNEPNGVYWGGTWQEFFKLYDHTANAVQRALPRARIGGCNVTGNGMNFLDAFLKHCVSDTNYVTGKIGSPLDMILFHAKGLPNVINGKVVMDVREQLKNITDNFAVIAKYPQLKNIPVILGESDPEGCAACSMATNPENAYRNGTMFSSYTAASFARIYELTDRHQKNLLGAVSWSFEFENQPWFGGFRDLATNGVDKPVLNVFRMFGKMSGKRVAVRSNRMYALDSVLQGSIRNQSDIGALAAIDKKNASVLVWNYHDIDQPGALDSVAVQLQGLPTGKKVFLSQYVIDKKHNNSYEVWKGMGSPQNPSKEQVNILEKAGTLQMTEEKKEIKLVDGKAVVNLKLESQSTMLLEIDWVN